MRIHKLYYILIIFLPIFIFSPQAFCSLGSSNYEAIVSAASSGTISSTSSSVYNLQSLTGQPAIGPSAQGVAPTGKDSNFGFLYLFQEETSRIEQYEIYDIQAFSSSTIKEISSTTWQIYNDPYFVWKTRLLTPSAIILGYSVSLDSLPDEIIDTTETYYDGFLATPIADGKHIFYVKAATTGEVWGDTFSFEFWVDTKEPRAQELQPAPGSIVKESRPTISLKLEDTHSGVDLDTIKLFVDDEAISFKYENGCLSSLPKTALPDGNRTARIQAKDFAGNLLNMSWGFTVDANLPIGSIIINGGEESTNYAKVRLNLAASDETTEVAQMILSNDGIFDTEDWEGFQTLRSDWVLSEPQKIGLKTVYCMFKDEAGNISDAYKDDIRLLSAAIDTMITTGPYSPTQETSAQFNYQSTLSDAVFSYKLDDQEWSEWSQNNSVSFNNLSLSNHIFSVKSAKDLDENKEISPEEEDPLPAQWTWVITTKEEPKKREKVLYWKTQ